MTQAPFVTVSLLRVTRFAFFFSLSLSPDTKWCARTRTRTRFVLKAVIVNHSFHFVVSSSSGTVWFSAPQKQNGGCFSVSVQPEKRAPVPRRPNCRSVV